MIPWTAEILGYSSGPAQGTTFASCGVWDAGVTENGLNLRGETTQLYHEIAILV